MTSLSDPFHSYFYPFRTSPTQWNHPASPINDAHNIKNHHHHPFPCPKPVPKTSKRMPHMADSTHSPTAEFPAFVSSPEAHHPSATSCPTTATKAVTTTAKTTTWATAGTQTMATTSEIDYQVLNDIQRWSTALRAQLHEDEKTRS
ncbi:hypothetical protein L208DRAFT_69547 [Tricholoma matsutake]|nr:hypothetical protein L208DRAFT_69547 [Tricholoma matsutake 945]